MNSSIDFRISDTFIECFKYNQEKFDKYFPVIKQNLENKLDVSSNREASDNNKYLKNDFTGLCAKNRKRYKGRVYLAVFSFQISNPFQAYLIFGKMFSIAIVIS